MRDLVVFWLALPVATFAFAKAAASPITRPRRWGAWLLLGLGAVACGYLAMVGAL